MRPGALRDGRVLRFPAVGRLLVSTDIQGNLKDFSRMVELFEAAGPDAYLLFTGDLVHGPSPLTAGEWPEHLGTPYVDESPAVVRAFCDAQADHPGRVFSLLGNHDHAHVGGPVVSKFYPNEAAVLEARLPPAELRAMRSLFRELPLLALAPCGVACLHAAPAIELDSLDELQAVTLEGYEAMSFVEFTRVPVLGPLLWARSAYPEVARRFLGVVGATVALFGHDIVREGFLRDAAEQLCFSTSFGLHDEKKVYVELDLSARYQKSTDLREGYELRKLYPDDVSR